ncbi:MAG: Nif3-like dinuclear metal center hexameric protein [Clostridia bacterium]|nr:Nif3-like dinuclear metal center hexameric protein [Clostridia bacterium]
MNKCNSLAIERKEAKEIYKLLNEYFHPERYQDFVKNGLILDNTEYIEQVYTATFSGAAIADVLRKEGAKNALLFTHHPGAQHKEGETGNLFTEQDLEFMKENNISHFSLHLPLDEVNPYSPGICLARVLNAVPYKSFFEEFGATMGLMCTTSCTNINEVLEKMEEVTGHPCKLYKYGDENLSDGRFALSAGGAEGTDFYKELKDEGVNLFITGVGSPEVDWFAPSHAEAKKQEISILSAGHYSTEKFALIDICRFFEERGLKAQFIEEIPCLTDL